MMPTCLLSYLLINSHIMQHQPTYSLLFYKFDIKTLNSQNYRSYPLNNKALKLAHLITKIFSTRKLTPRRKKQNNMYIPL